MSVRASLPHHHEYENGDHLHSGNIHQMLPDHTELQAVSDAMKQLGDPTRLQIFWILCHCEECVTNLGAMIGMTAPAVSHHLRLLKASGLVTSRRIGKEMHYKAADTPLVESLHRTVEDIIQIACPSL
ncbi:MAG: winged helix-turn-helix transcriptional regulator [Blautia sp.]|nr:winged helix-turn-helix transcriptional regulator [Blautia sp.]